MHKNFRQTAEKILGRELHPNEGIKESKIEKIERKLGILIPQSLKDFYISLGKNKLFTDGFQHFADIDELFIKDGKLVFLEENQAVVYWAVDLADKTTIYQTSDFEENTEWYKEEYSLEDFLELMLYFQCVMSDDYWHEESKSGFQYFADLGEKYCQNPQEIKPLLEYLKKEYTEVSNAQYLKIFWKSDTIIALFLDNNGNFTNIMACTKSTKVLDKLIDNYHFGEL